MAKSLEDTAFYRYHRLLALNEVGGDPSVGALTPEDFHRRMLARSQSQPHGLTATATHDTKRGEDARARILALSELADEWSNVTRQWRELNAVATQHRGESPLPCARIHALPGFAWRLAWRYRPGFRRAHAKLCGEGRARRQGTDQLGSRRTKPMKRACRIFWRAFSTGHAPPPSWIHLKPSHAAPRCWARSIVSLRSP